jgi:hypothetical protein
MAKLLERRERVRAKVDDLGAEQRQATAAAQVASERLAALEREALSGAKVSAATRREAEQALEQARSKASEPWAERIAGTQAAQRDAQVELQRFVSEHLDELVADLEQDGEAAAARLTEHARGIGAALSERERIAGEISSLISMIGRVEPGDVSRSRAEALARAASNLITEGGEDPPRLVRDPRVPRHGELEPAESAA